MEKEIENPWEMKNVIDYFKLNRKSIDHLYKSEWFFIKNFLAEDIAILDIGCALGGFANACSEKIKNFEYTGLDISINMIENAKKIHPNHKFYHIKEADLEVLQGKKYDLVICLGILHLSEKWRELLKEAWEVTSGAFIFDLRETEKKSIENINESYFKMDYNSLEENYSEKKIPYNILNVSDSLNFIIKNLNSVKSFSKFGYMHPVSSSAVTPISDVLMNTYCLEKKLIT